MPANVSSKTVGEGGAVLDLAPFCGTDDTHDYLMKPFSAGEFTYATNGHIMVRVPRRPDAMEPTTKFSWDAPIKGWDRASYEPLRGSLPPIEKVDCICFDGHAHACPGCNCVCPKCHGTGQAYPAISAGIGDVPFAIHYVAMLLALPGIEVTTKPEQRQPLLFRFDGGIGALMPLQCPLSEHIELSSPSLSKGSQE